MALFTYETKKDTRSGFGAGMEYLSQHNPKVVALCADLIGSLKLEGFIKNSPERFFQTGIAEANMIGISAGLTLGGLFRLQLRLQTLEQVVFMTKSVNQWLILERM